MGAPKKLLTDAQKKELPKLAGYGMTLEQIADLFGMGKDTLRTRFKEDPEVLLSYKKGKGKALSMVTEKLFDLIKKGDKTSIYFYLKTQAGWRETQQVDLTTADEKLSFTLTINNNGDS